MKWARNGKPLLLAYHGPCLMTNKIQTSFEDTVLIKSCQMWRYALRNIEQRFAIAVVFWTRVWVTGSVITLNLRGQNCFFAVLDEELCLRYQISSGAMQESAIQSIL